MNTSELASSLAKITKCSRALYAVLPSDKLLNFVVNKFPVCIILNSKPSYHEGEHWICLFRQSSVTPFEFFDSFGKGIDFYDKSFRLFVGNNLVERNVRLQGFSLLCGQWCLMYLFMSMQRKSRKTFYSKFSNNYQKNDFIVKHTVARFQACKITCNQQTIQTCSIKEY